jgi:chromosome partitioning protein
VVPRNVRLGESPSHGLPVLLYDPASKGAEAYRLLAKELLDQIVTERSEAEQRLKEEIHEGEETSTR